MTYQQLVKTMIGWGFEIKPEHYHGFNSYVSQMLEKDRVMIVRTNMQPILIIFYYLTNDYTKIYKKSTWEIAEDSPEGHQIYVDKMVCRHWTRDLRNAVKRAIEDKYPLVSEAYYHRAPFDRCVKINRGEGVLCSKI